MKSMKTFFALWITILVIAISLFPNVAFAGCADLGGECAYVGKCANDSIPIAGKEECNNVEGGVCCIKKAPVSPTPPACLGLCLPVEQCDPTTITAQPSQEPGKNKACGEGTSDGYACCGAVKKETLSPTGLPCCIPTDQCKTKINPGVVCPQKGYGCCISAEANGGSTESTINDKCGDVNFPCPLGTDIPALLGNVIAWVLGLVGALFLAMFVWGGALYITAGDSKRAEEGQKTLVNAVIGVVIVMLSYTMVNWVLSKISGF